MNLELHLFYIILEGWMDGSVVGLDLVFMDGVYISLATLPSCVCFLYDFGI